MSPPAPPSNVLPFLQEAAAGTGLPLTVVEAQNKTESDYGRNQGPSSAGAEGPWQFLPSTFAGVGHGSITSWSDSTAAYIAYMNQLLRQEHGNVRNALAAYNAGPGNIPAGLGYADSILAEAGQSQGLQQGPQQVSHQPNQPNTPTNPGGSGGGILSWPGEITSFFSSANGFVNKLMWLVEPGSWVRIVAFIAGIALLLFAIHAFIAANKDEPIVKTPSTIPVPVPL